MIKERLGVSEEETVEQVRENPYLQYFLGLSEYSDRAPFDASMSMMTHFRQRLSLELATQVNEAVVQVVLVPKAASAESMEAEAAPPTQSEPVELSANDDNNDSDDDPPNQGQLLFDALNPYLLLSRQRRQVIYPFREEVDVLGLHKS